MKFRHVGLLALTLLAPMLPAKSQLVSSGGGLSPATSTDCITPKEREHLASVIARHQSKLAGKIHPTLAGPEPYPFVPQAGNLWDDLFVTNFVDMDNTTGIRDWDNTDWTYDGHRGHDLSLRSFAEQDGGVPIFAALDGQVVDAHDGEYDRNTTFNASAVANSVTLWHGGTHYTYYWHMRAGSVAVGIGAQIKRGTQIGLTGSSGYSSGPHLHFESWYANNYFEPSTGVANPGLSSWVNQPTIPRNLYCEEFNVTNVNIGAYPGLPTDIPRTGTFRLSPNTYQGVKFWTILHNVPANSPYRIRFLRPNGTVNFDSAVQNLNNGAAYRWAWYWWWWNVLLDTTGEWKIELSINNQIVALSPFRVVGASETIVNRAPENVTARFDPANPTTSDAIFCRLTVPLINDKDYDLVRYHYVWRVNGATVRDITSVSHADALAKGVANDGDTVTCEVTPTDGYAYATTYTLSTSVLGTKRVTVSGKVSFSAIAQGTATLTFEFRPPTLGPAVIKQATLNAATGLYTFSDIPNKSYVLHVKGNKWLARNLPINAIGGNLANVNLTLLSGDIDNNNTIDADDLIELVSHYNSVIGDGVYVANSDLNNDNSIDADDLIELVSNYNTNGDP